MGRGLSVYIVLYFAIAASAVAVVQLRHQHRQAKAALHEARQQARNLAAEADQLELERAALAAPAKIEGLARQQLDMVLPEQVQVLSAGGEQ